MKKFAIATMVVSIFIAVLPLLSVLVAGLLASLFGCSINESGTSTCPTVFGDLGGMLTLMGIFGWLLFYSVPIGFAGLLLGAVLLAVALIRSKKKNVSSEESQLQ